LLDRLPGDFKAVNIKSILARLQSAMGRQDLVEQMVLLPLAAPDADGTKSTKSVNLVVGYNRTRSSQTALDLTLWIAHQTRLAAKAQVTVHIVYVVESDHDRECPDILNSAVASSSLIYWLPLELPEVPAPRSTTPVLTEPRQQVLAACPQMTLVAPCYLNGISHYTNPYEPADQILSQARCLAREWGGSFVTHLRFGSVAAELRKVVESEAAALLLLGCNSANHSVIQQLGANFPCPVLGIPNELNQSEDSNSSSM